MSYELRDTATIEEMKMFQNMADIPFDTNAYSRALNEFHNDKHDTTYYDSCDDKQCKCVKQYLPSSAHVTHYMCLSNNQKDCKYAATEGLSKECCFLAKMSLPQSMGRVIKSCTNWDAHAEADRDTN